MNLQDQVNIIDNLFLDYMVAKLNNSQLEKNLAYTLSNINDCNNEFKVFIVESNKFDPIFFMRITPDLDCSQALLSEIKNEKISYKKMKERWESIKKWNLEIDSKCLDKTKISFNPQELTALLIHEIGHVIYSNSVIERFYRMFNEARLKFSLADRTKFKFMTFMYIIPLYCASVAHDFRIGKNGILEEQYCDALTKSVNYENHLINACNKIIRFYGNFILKNEDQNDKEVETQINWANTNISDLISRKHKLKNELVFKTIQTRSSVFKAIYMYLASKIGIYIKDNKTGLVMEVNLNSINNFSYCNYEICVNNNLANIENYFNNYKSNSKIAIEGLFKDKNRKNEISEYDIDAVEIEVDRIENHHDRIFVLDLIYELLEKIDIIEELCKTDERIKRKYETKINYFRERLFDIRSRVMAKKNLDKEYKLFIKVPNGYEG